MKKKILGIAIVVAVLISAVAFAQKNETRKEFGKKGEMQMRPDFRPRGQAGNFFTEEQQEAIKKIKVETEKEIKPLRNKLREMEAHQQTLTTADKANMGAIYKNIDEMSEVKAEMAKIRASKHQEIRKLLTEEQLIKFDSFKGKRFDGERDPQGFRMDRKMGDKMDRGIDRAGDDIMPPFEGE